MILVSVVVVSWDGLDQLTRCLPSLMASLRLVPGESEVFVVDNGSSDGTAEYVAATYPSVRLIRNSANRGFGAANNQAFARASGRFIATLNNDTVVDERWLVELLAAIEPDAAVGSVSAQMRFLDWPEVINTTGIEVDRLGIARDRLDGEPVSASETTPTEVFGACAGAAVYRAELLEGLRGFDESFFAYYEDVDLAWRARRAGWRCRYVPTAVVFHEYSATTRRIPRLKTYLIARNRIWMVAKNASVRQVLGGNVVRTLADEAARVVGSLFLERSTAGIRGRLAGMWGLPAALRKRGDLPMLDPAEFSEPVPLRQRLRSRLGRDRLLLAHP